MVYVNSKMIIIEFILKVVKIFNVWKEFICIIYEFLFSVCSEDVVKVEIEERDESSFYYAIDVF